MSATAPLTRAILDALRTDPAAITELRELLALDSPQPTRPEDGWLTAKQAAEYLALTLTALHKHTAARSIPFEQEGRGCKLWFRRSELDAWRRGEKLSAAKAQPRTAFPPLLRTD